MTLLRSLLYRTARVFSLQRMNRDIDDELRSHIEHRADDLERSGVSRAEAERRARIEFGGVESVGEACHEAAGGRPGETLTRDIGYGFRVLRKSPAFTGVAILTLALAIGANAVVFGVLNAMILRPMDLPHIDSLYSVHRVADNNASQSYLDIQDFRARNHSFDDLASFAFRQAGFETQGLATRSWLLAVTGNYFDVLQVQPQLGRLFHESDEHGPNSAPYIVLADGFWRSRFQADPNVIGRVVQLNKHPFIVIGVAPETFRGTLLFFTPDFFMPVVNQEQLDGVNMLSGRNERIFFMMLGHLKPGVTKQQAAGDIDSIQHELETSYPKEHAHATYKLARPSLYGDYLGGPVKAFLGALLVLATLILLAACANLGSLFAARAADRSREVALRVALGATRIRIMRQLLTEAFLVSLTGAAVGLTGAVILLRVLGTWRPFTQFPINLPIKSDPVVYIFALLLAVLSGLLFGAMPLRQVLATNPYEVVKAGGRTTADRRFTFRDVLVIAQIAICAVLVTGSIVAVRGLLHSMHSHVGFVPENAILVSTDPGMAGYRGDAVPILQKRMLEEMQSIPGVSAAAITTWVQLRGDLQSESIFTESTVDTRPANAFAKVASFGVSPDYFRAAGTALLHGRAFTWHDDQHAPDVAVISTELARRMFGSSETALGRKFKNSGGKLIEIVGVCESGKYQSLTEHQIGAIYRPILQSSSNLSWMIVRSDREPQQLTAAIKSKLHEVDPAIPPEILTWTDAMQLALFPSHVAAYSLGVLGIMGAVLSISGIFGIAAYSVSRRMRELGLRVALGAQQRQLLSAALARPLRLVAFGSAGGLVLGVIASRVLAYIVYEATPRDPVVLAGSVMTMFALGAIATWVPARRALTADPLMLLRED